MPMSSEPPTRIEPCELEPTTSMSEAGETSRWKLERIFVFSGKWTIYFSAQGWTNRLLPTLFESSTETSTWTPHRRCWL
jgi:hypothetical protein